MSDALIERLRKRLADAPAQPWAYRPDKHDDWGFIRGPERDDLSIGPFRPIVAIGKDSMVPEADMSAHRAAGTDPYGPSALLIVEAVNALPDLLTAIEAQARRIAELEQRGAEAVIAYHVAICSPKGVVPVDDLYDADMAATIQSALDAGIPVRYSPPLPDTGLQA